MSAKTKRFGLILLIAAASASATAQAGEITLTLDLNDLSTGLLTSSVSVDGFTLTPDCCSTPEITSVGGLNVLGSSNNNYGHGAGMILSMNGGGSFTLDSVEVADTAGDDYDVINIGNYISTVVNFGAGNNDLPSTLTEYDFSSGFQNITDVYFNPVSNNGGNPVIGDITVSYYTSTPEPGTLGLLSLGAIGLILVRRRGMSLKTGELSTDPGVSG